MAQFPEFLMGDLSWKDFQKQFKQEPPLKSALSYVCPENLADLFAHMERKDLRVAEVYMHPLTYSGIRKWNRDIVDPVTDAESAKNGLLAYIWGADIFVRRTVPKRLVMAVSDKKFVTAAILHLNEEVFPGGEYLAQCEKRIQEMSSELQSMLRKASQTIRDMLIKVEENRQ